MRHNSKSTDEELQVINKYIIDNEHGNKMCFIGQETENRKLRLVKTRFQQAL